jgi:hypothetical protein
VIHTVKKEWTPFFKDMATSCFEIMKENLQRAQPHERLRSLGVELPKGNDPAAIRQRLEMLEMLLERCFVIPGTKRQVGLDSIAGLIPAVGDFITASMGCYLIWEARNLGLPKWILARMARNVAIDMALGSVPVVGDLFDFFYRSNTRNLKILKDYLDKIHPAGQVIEVRPEVK